MAQRGEDGKRWAMRGSLAEAHSIAINLAGGGKADRAVTCLRPGFLDNMHN